MDNSSKISAIDLNILLENIFSTLPKNKKIKFIDLNHLPENDDIVCFPSDINKLKRIIKLAFHISIYFGKLKCIKWGRLYSK